MQKVSFPRARWWNLAVPLIVALIITTDQLSKNLIRSYPVGHVIFEWRFFRIIHIYNTGASFGIFQGHNLVLTIAAIVALVVLMCLAVFVYRRYPQYVTIPNRIVFSLIIGGISGNLIDRIVHSSVTDFLDLTYWPAFNVADSASVIGAIIAILSIIRMIRTEGL